LFREPSDRGRPRSWSSVQSPGAVHRPTPRVGYLAPGWRACLGSRRLRVGGALNYLIARKETIARAGREPGHLRAIEPRGFGWWLANSCTLVHSFIASKPFCLHSAHFRKSLRGGFAFPLLYISPHLRNVIETAGGPRQASSRAGGLGETRGEGLPGNCGGRGILKSGSSSSEW
jgi:hypothetical protein